MVHEERMFSTKLWKTAHPVCAYKGAMKTLTFPQMCVDAHVSGSSSQTLVFSVWDMLLCLGVYVLFCKAKVYDVNGVVPFRAGSAHQEVLRLHVSIDEASGVDKLHTGYLSETAASQSVSHTSLLRFETKISALIQVSHQLDGYHEYSF